MTTCIERSSGGVHQLCMDKCLDESYPRRRYVLITLSKNSLENEDQMKGFIAIYAVFSCITIYIFRLINGVQQEPYMDEIFHVPQVQAYCSGNFTHWDPMITTLPGLYLISVGLFKPLSVLGDVLMTEICSTVWLRATNILFTLGNVYLIYAVQKKLHNPLTDPNGVRLNMTTLALSMFPVLYFFTFLYYTDCGSTFFVLIMYLFSLYGNHKVAAIMGIAATGFRQTNIMWVIFVAGLSVRKHLFTWMRGEVKKNDKKLEKILDFDLLKMTIDVLYKSIVNRQNRQKALKHFILSVVKDVWPYLLVGIGFGIFVVLNKGIVVGDRSNHTVSLHVPQVFYYLAMTNFFAIFHLTSPYRIWNFLKFCWKNPLFALTFHIIAFLAVHYLTYEHKYLLADNRHYTFYIWSKIFRRHSYVRYILVPGYLYCFWSVVTALKHRDIYWKLIFSLCIIATAVPQQLLEFRYFIIPYLIFRINMTYGTALGTLHEIILYISVNAFTVFMFVKRPFEWPHQVGVQRFIW